MAAPLLPPSDLLVTVAEPTRLRILNCLAAGPMFVSDLITVLDLPQPTVSRHLKVLRDAQVVTDTQIAQFVLYRLAHLTRPRDRLLRSVLDGVHQEERFKAERHRAQDLRRSRPRRQPGDTTINHNRISSA